MSICFCQGGAGGVVRVRYEDKALSGENKYVQAHTRVCIQRRVRDENMYENMFESQQQQKQRQPHHQHHQNPNQTHHHISNNNHHQSQKKKTKKLTSHKNGF